MSASLRIARVLFAVAWGANHFVPLLIVYRVQLHLGDVDLATLFGVYAVALVPGLLLGGPLSDRFGRRAVVVPAALLALVGSAVLAGGAWVGAPALYLGRSIVGLGSGATFTAGTAWMQDVASNEPEGVGARRAAVALSLGFGGGPLVAAAFAQWLPAPMAVPYLVQGIALALSLPGLLTVRPAPRAARARSRGPFVPPGFWRALVPVAPWVFAFPSIAFAVLPPLVRDRVGSLAVLYAGAVTAATLAAGVLVQRPLATRSIRFARVLGLVCGAVGATMGAVATRAHSALLVFVASLLLGVGYGGTLIAGLRMSTAGSDPADRGRVTGVFYVLAYLGFALPLILATVSRYVGTVASQLVVAALAAVTAAIQSVGTGVVRAPRDETHA